MKKIVGLLLMIFAVYGSIQAQDIITLKSGVELKAKIVKLKPGNVLYILPESTDTTSIMRKEVLKLWYQNGTIVYLSDESSPRTEYEPGHDSMYYAGVSDANMYYKGYKSAATGTAVSVLAMPWNLIPAIACSSKGPSVENLGFRDSKLMENSSYYYGYTSQAHKIKKRKVWKAYAVSTGAYVGMIVILSAALAF